MIRHSPAENYFKYLVVHPSCYGNTDIKHMAVELGLDCLGDWYLQWLRDRVRPPTPFYPEDSHHHASQRFLLKESLDKVFNPTRGMVEAQRILSRPRWRELVETMILGGAPNDAVVQAVCARFHTSITLEGIRLFKFFYWNIDLLGSMEMRALLDLRHRGLLNGDIAEKDIAVQYTALHRMRHTDPRVIAARLPSTPLAGLVAQMELGAMPKRVNMADIVDRTMTTSLLRTFDAVHSGGPQGAQMGQSYAVVADIMGRLKETVVQPEDTLRKDLRKIAIATTPRQVPTVSQLTAGNHTTNLQPEPKPDEVVDATFEEDVIPDEEDTDDDADADETE